LDKYSLFLRSGKKEIVYNWLQCFDIDSLKKEVEDAELNMQSVFSDVCGNEYNSDLTELAVVVEKS
jgi:hypothetical protein